MVEKRRDWLAALLKGGTLGILLMGVLAVGCLTRPVISQNPTTKTSFQTQVKQQTIDKIDMLFAIDNSASMGDKQDLLAAAVPILVQRLLAPNCVDTTGIACTKTADCSSLGANADCDLSSGTGQCYVPSSGAACTGNTKQEFPPVHDLHIGIVSSSLGGGGATDICVPLTNDTTHQNDGAHLLNRTKVANCTSSTGCDGPPITNANPTTPPGGNFLAWLPASNPLNAGKTPPNVTIYNDGQQAQLVTDFQSLVKGVQEHGCGLEAQLESWYRFLIQPDPYNQIVLGGGGVPPAQLKDIDTVLLKQRHDFLRADSLVAIIQLTDEEDSWSDPLWGGGFGWTVRTLNFPGGPGASSGVGPRGTSDCDVPINPNSPTQGPNDPNCTSCAFQGKKANGNDIASDPNCTSCYGGATTCQKGWYTTQQDGVNVRYSTQVMRKKYGLDPQWNIQRYVDGLRLPKVPNQAGEVHDTTQYASTNRNCINPLYAQNLPDGTDTSMGTLCTNLQPGPRTPDLVFYAIIGGVPNSLLYNTAGNFKLNLGPDDWTKILGKDPSTFQFDGIDPHMVESVTERPAPLVQPGSTYSLGTDPDNGREWNTLTSSAGIDLQYACTFQLPNSKDCTQPQFQGACDCTGPAITTADGPPLCDPTTRNVQTRGKAYPTIRELQVAKGLGSQAVVASLCAKDTNPADVALPNYGYNPAMQAIVNRLKNVLGGQCLPETLSPSSDCSVPCNVLVIYTNQTDQGAGCTDNGMCNPQNPTAACGGGGAPLCAANDQTCIQQYQDLLKRFQQQQQAQAADAGTSTGTPVVCVYEQLAGGTASSVAQATGCSNASPGYQGISCDQDKNASAGWCYVVGVQNTGGCPQAIKFAGAGPPGGTTINLECIEQRGAGDAGGGGG